VPGEQSGDRPLGVREFTAVYKIEREFEYCWNNQLPEMANAMKSEVVRALTDTFEGHAQQTETG
jgi:hypothetical protein